MSSADTYKKQQIMTATPEQLILMLYNGCIQAINEAVKSMEANNIEGAHNACIKAQNILIELQVSLDREMPIAEDLLLLYQYAENSIALGNFKKEATYLENAKTVVANIREGWVEAIKIAREQGTLADSRKVAGDSSISV